MKKMAGEEREERRMGGDWGTENVVGLGPFLRKSLSGYPSSTGTMSRRMPPGFIVATASSTAGMAVCCPRVNLYSSLSAPRPNEPPLACTPPWTSDAPDQIRLNDLCACESHIKDKTAWTSGVPDQVRLDVLCAH